MDINSIFVVTAAVVFTGMLYFVHYSPQGWRMRWLRFPRLDQVILRDLAQKIGLFAMGLAAVRGYVDKEIGMVAPHILFVVGALLCYFSACKPPDES